MIRRLHSTDFDAVWRVINDAAHAYHGVIPDDRWKNPYMPTAELRDAIQSGVKFYGWIENNEVLGVMGLQPVQNTTLIRHSYVLTTHQRQGIGGKLLNHLVQLATTPDILVGTWTDATWAIHFYQKHGFKLVSTREKTHLLRTYWDIPARQIDTSVVLRLTM